MKRRGETPSTTQDTRPTIRRLGLPVPTAKCVEELRATGWGSCSKPIQATDPRPRLKNRQNPRTVKQTNRLTGQSLPLRRQGDKPTNGRNRINGSTVQPTKPTNGQTDQSLPLRTQGVKRIKPTHTYVCGQERSGTNVRATGRVSYSELPRVTGRGKPVPFLTALGNWSATIYGCRKSMGEALRNILTGGRN